MASNKALFRAKGRVVEFPKKRCVDKKAGANTAGSTSDRCPDCKYGSDGKLARQCIDCWYEENETDDAFDDLWRGPNACEVCGLPTEGEANLCWIHMRLL